MTPILVIGSGGHCRAVLSVLFSEKKWDVIGIIDINTNTTIKGEIILGVPVLTDLNSLLINNDPNVNQAIVATGGNNERSVIHQKLKNIGFEFPRVFSSSSIVDPTARIGNGTVVMHGAIIGPIVEVGEGCIVNTNSVLEHGSIIGNWSHIATGSIVSGGSNLGECVFLGAGSIVIDGLTVTDNVIIGAGSVVIKDIFDEYETYVGAPAEKIKT
jgi:sugar O-acyltransferase (sialic acid O-acetyltransferase NeuD family)